MEAKQQYAERIHKEDPRAEIYEVTHDRVQEPWESRRLERIFNKIVTKVFEFEESTNDFTVRKTLLEDADILEFQRGHPRLYYVLTDRKLLREEKYKNVLKNMLLLRQRVERESLASDERTDAMATNVIISSLMSEKREEM